MTETEPYSMGGVYVRLLLVGAKWRRLGRFAMWLFIGAVVMNFLVGGLATKYVVDYWGSFIRKGSIDANFWACGAAAILIAEVTIPAAVVTWLISLGLDNPDYGG